MIRGKAQKVKVRRRTPRTTGARGINLYGKKGPNVVLKKKKTQSGQDMNVQA